MPRTKGSKNKNTATAKNKNIININVNSSKSKKGRPRKTTANTNAQTRYPTYGGGNANAPPQVIISQPQADNSNINNSLLSSFMTSKILSESMNSNRSNMTAVEPSKLEQPSYFNARESIIPKLPDTPIRQEVKPPTANLNGPPPPPPPPPPITTTKKNEPPKGLDLTGLSGRDAMLAELKYSQSEEGKAEKARKKAEAAAKKEAKKIEKEVSPQKQSTADFLNLTFTPPKRDIVEMMTPSKPTSTAIVPYRENKSLLEFVAGGTPQKPKPTKEDIKKQRLQELQKKKQLNTKETFELNNLKSFFTAQPNQNPNIAGSIITKAIKNKIARKDFKEAQDNYDPAKHQEKIREKRKEFTRIITTQSTTQQAKENAQKRLNKTEYLFKRKSNAGRPPANQFQGLKQTEL